MARLTSNGKEEFLTDPPSEYTSVYRGAIAQKGITMIDKNNPPKYLRQMDTGRIYVYREILADRADMEAYEMPVKEDAPAAPPVDHIVDVPNMIDGPIPEDPQPAAPATEFAGDDRKTLIKGAISMILPEEYSRAIGGRPAMPKVAQVSQIVGFKVSADEILKAMEG